MFISSVRPDAVELTRSHNTLRFKNPRRFFLVPQTQRRAVSLMFSLFVDVLSYHAQAKVNQDSCARDKTSHSSQSSWETDRENRKMYLVLWKNSRNAFLHEFYQICDFWKEKKLTRAVFDFWLYIFILWLCQSNHWMVSVRRKIKGGGGKKVDIAIQWAIYWCRLKQISTKSSLMIFLFFLLLGMKLGGLQVVVVLINWRWRPPVMSHCKQLSQCYDN